MALKVIHNDGRSIGLEWTVTSTGTQDAYKVPPSWERVTFGMSIVSGSPTVKLQASLDGSTWFDVIELSDGDLYSYHIGFPWLRLDVSGATPFEAKVHLLRQ